MISRYRWISLLLIAVLVWPLAALAANSDGVALVIGNQSYRNPQVPAVEYAHRDADAIDRYLVDVLGYRDGNIIDLRDATLAEMEAALGNAQTPEGRLWQLVKPGKSDITVYFSGHGAPGQQDHKGYLLPSDADPEKPAINGYHIGLLIDNLAKLGARTTTVYLDACFSGDTPRGSLLHSASAIRIVPKEPAVPPGMTVITAGQADQVASWDSRNHHGLFTETLLDGLYGQADRSPYGNGDGKVSAREIKAYLDDVMTYAARREFGRTQVASMYGDTDRVLVALPGGRPIARVDVPDPRKPVPQIAEAPPAASPAPAPPLQRRAERLAQPSTYDACSDSDPGDRVHIVTPHGNVPGVCVQTVDGLVARPLRHPGTEPASAAQIVPPTAREAAPSPDTDALYWSSIKDSSKVADYGAYLRRFPMGTFADLARSRIEDLSRQPLPPQLMAPAAARVVVPPAARASGSVLFASTTAAQVSCPGDNVVWVNTPTGVYHYPGTRWYGRTREGAYMCESQRDVIGARPARNHQ